VISEYETIRSEIYNINKEINEKKDNLAIDIAYISMAYPAPIQELLGLNTKIMIHVKDMIETKICNNYYARDNVNTPETEDEYRVIVANVESLFVMIDDKLSTYNTNQCKISDQILNVLLKMQSSANNPGYRMLMNSYKAAPKLILSFYKNMLDDMIKFNETIELRSQQINQTIGPVSSK